MTLRRWLTGVLVLLAGVLLLVVLTLLFVPATDLVGVVQRGMARQGLTLEVASVGRAFPLGITARRVTLIAEQGQLMVVDRLTCRFHLLPLLLGRLQWSAEAVIGSGHLTLAGSLGKRPELTVDSSGLRLERLPVLKTALGGGSVQGGFRVSGALTGNWPQATGSLTVDATAVDLQGVSLGGMRLPDALYRTVRGQLAIGNGTVTVQSIALDGEGIYARLSGTLPVTAPITAAPLSLKFELMPKPEFMERQKLIFLLLVKFLVSPGNYHLPIKGTLGAPSVF